MINHEAARWLASGFWLMYSWFYRKWLWYKHVLWTIALSKDITLAYIVPTFFFRAVVFVQSNICGLSAPHFDLLYFSAINTLYSDVYVLPVFSNMWFFLCHRFPTQVNRKQLSQKNFCSFPEAAYSLMRLQIFLLKKKKSFLHHFLNN